jgi:hypothetical protein
MRVVEKNGNAAEDEMHIAVTFVNLRPSWQGLFKVANDFSIPKSRGRESSNRGFLTISPVSVQAKIEGLRIAKQAFSAAHAVTKAVDEYSPCCPPHPVPAAIAWQRKPLSRSALNSWMKTWPILQARVRRQITGTPRGRR